MIRDIPHLKTKWRVDGGAVKNNLLLQIQADILNLPLIRPKNLEATGTGIAFLSAYSSGALSLEDIQKIWKQEAVFRPSKKNSKYLESNYKHWLEATHQV
jgi:glycerol kinase